jgi:hypothetical protein
MVLEFLANKIERERKGGTPRIVSQASGQKKNKDKKKTKKTEKKERETTE